MTGILTKGGNLDVETVRTPCEEETQKSLKRKTAEIASKSPEAKGDSSQGGTNNANT